MSDLTIPRDTWSYKVAWAPNDYYTGELVESWEWKDPQTLTCHVREGIKWQNKAPVYGREFTAEDVQWHYDRLFGTGNFTKANPYCLGWIPAIKGTTLVDTYTFEINFKNPTPLANMSSVCEMGSPNQIEPREAVEAGLTDWKNFTGTGAYMITDYMKGSYLSFTKNPDYWGTDERHPGNKLPYIENVKILVIADVATTLSALRTGKLDLVSSVTWQMAKAVGKTSSELAQYTVPGNGYCLTFRVDQVPFTDVNVRKAMQMAVNFPEIVSGYYGDTSAKDPAGICSAAYIGYCTPFSQWPEELQEEYSYNPEKAKQLLSDAGYPNGFKTNVVASTDQDLQLLQAVKGYLMTNLNVDMEIKSMDQTTYMFYCQAGKHDQMAMDVYTSETWPPTMMIYNTTSTNPTNFSRNNDPVFDAMYTKLMASQTNDEFKQILNEADQYTLQKHWYLNLPGLNTFTIHQPYLKGLAGENVAAGMGASPIRHWLLDRMWIDQKLKTSMGH
jgi:peptide/nickel transport system substrate-binding protein